MRHVDVLSRNRGIGHADFILLLLLQQIEVEALLDFLVAFYRNQFLGLLRTGCHLPFGLFVELLYGVHLHLQCPDKLVDIVQNVLADI